LDKGYTQEEILNTINKQVYDSLRSLLSTYINKIGLNKSISYNKIIIEEMYNNFSMTVINFYVLCITHIIHCNHIFLNLFSF